MKTIISVEAICYYHRKGFSYFKSLAGDRFKVRGIFEQGKKQLRIEIQ